MSQGKEHSEMVIQSQPLCSDQQDRGSQIRITAGFIYSLAVDWPVLLIDQRFQSPGVPGLNYSVIRGEW